MSKEQATPTKASAHVSQDQVPSTLPETKHDAPPHHQEEQGTTIPQSKQLHAISKKTKSGLPWDKNLFSSESEDEGYTTPPIEVKSDDSSGDESEGDGSDFEIMEDYDEQLQDNYEMHVIDDSGF